MNSKDQLKLSLDPGLPAPVEQSKQWFRSEVGCASSDSLLSESEQERLAEILDDYLKAIEQGSPVTPEELLAQYPDDADQLATYLSGLKYFHSVAVEPEFNLLTTNVDDESTEPIKTIGDYRLMNEIGRGGMGVVYDAEQISLGRRVALKVLPFTMKHHAKQISRFKNEARAAASIEHPNIVPVHAVGEEEGVHFFAMQLVEGQSLSEILEDLIAADEFGCEMAEEIARLAKPQNENQDETFSGPQPSQLANIGSTVDHVRTLARLGQQAAEALHAAHQVGVVHRDIKPSNLMVDDHGKLWITDFGLASCRDSTGVTQTGEVLGTMRYMSPEQARGENERVDHRTDIYSLGVTLYEMASLNHPSGNSSDLQILTGSEPFKQIALRSWNREIPKDFQTIIMKSLSDNPVQRYATGKEMSDDLNRFIEGRTIQAKPPSVADRTTKWVQRHRKLATLLGLIFIASVMSQAFNNFLLNNSNREKEQALVQAHQNLQQAHAVLDRFGTRLVDQLVAIPGAEGIRYQLLSDSLTFYEKFEARAQGGSEWETELAHAQSKMGSLSEKMGRDDVAITKHLAALGYWEAHYKQKPLDHSAARNLALCQNNVGLLLDKPEQQNEAISRLTQAQEIQTSLIAAGFEVDLVGVELATTCNNLGTIYHQIGNSIKAIEYFEKAIEQQNQISNEGQASESNLRCLAISYNNLASLNPRSASDSAESFFREAIEIQLQLVKSHPANRIYQSELACTYNNLGFLSASKSDWKTASNDYVDAQRIQEHLVRASPNFATYQRDLAVTLNNLGMTQSQQNQWSESESSFAEAIKLFQKLTEQHQQNAKTVSSLGSAYNNLALLLAKQRRHAEAEIAYRSAIESQTAAFQLSKSNRSRDLLSNHYVNYSRFLRVDLHRDQDADALAQTRQTLLANSR